MSSASTAGGAASLMSPAGSSRHHVAGRTAQRMAAGEGSALPLSPSKLESPFFKERVAALLTQGDAYAKRLDGERRRAAELDAALAALRAQHLAAHRQLRAGGDERKPIEDSANGSASAKLPLRTLENRLEQVLTRFNQVRSANKALRDDIQALRRDKVTQQQIHDRLARETHTASAELAKVVQAAQAAGDARDRAARQVEALRAQQADDGAEFEAGWHERATQLEQDRAGIRDLPRLRTPKPKSTPHFCADGAPASPAPRALAPSGAGGSGAGAAGFKLLSTPEVKLRDETQKTGWLISEKEGDLRRQSERLRAAEDGLAKIKRRTGVADAQELARALVAAEEKNFSLFNMINELGTEMEALEVDNKALEEQIAQCAGSGRSSDAHRRELQQQLEAQIDVSKSKMQFLEARQGEATDALEAMKQGALAIFHKVGSADEAFAALLAAHGLTDVTLAKLLGVIEQRVSELVDMHNLTTAGSTAVDSAIGPVGHPLKPDGGGDSNAHHKGGRRPHAPGGHGGGHQTASNVAGSGAVGGLLRPTPPTADDFNDSDGEDGEDAVRPCRIADIQEKTAAAVGRRKEKQMRSKR